MSAQISSFSLGLATVWQTVTKFQSSVDDVKVLFLRPIDLIAQCFSFYGNQTVVPLMTSQCSGYLNLMDVIIRTKVLFFDAVSYSNFDFSGPVSAIQDREWIFEFESSEKVTLREKIIQKVIQFASFFDRAYSSASFIGAFYGKKIVFLGQSLILTACRFIEPLNVVLTESCKLLNNRLKKVSENTKESFMIEMNRDEKISVIIKLAFSVTWFAMSVLGMISLAGIAIPCAGGVKLSLTGIATLLGLSSYFWDNVILEKRDFKS